MNRSLPYAGTELEIFAAAITWKRYWSSFVTPLLNGDVLEVGAGLGANVSLLCSDAVRRWVSLEPDLTLCQRLHTELQRLSLSQRCHLVHGTLYDLPEHDCFDTVLYLDVLEHIVDDGAELRRAVSHLRPGGALIILAPAHPCLYTDFDRAIGHQRRYTKATLRKTVPLGLTEQLLIYLDSIGLLASGANRLLLHQAMPTPRQILLWDRVLVSLSRIADPVLRYSLGKSLLGVWRKPVGY
jgi:SAM-dependent methyltransferase